MKYIITIASNASHEREYPTDSRSAMKAAEQYGRCEGGETVTVWTKSGKEISRVVWTPEGGGRYLRVAL
ncbi:MAG TPA: hypothetical protein IAB50_03480 [Candidatus Faecivicinus avistercoris]|nr:hypothetical protein [Candidatus Faecivicinus avistercoris]